MPTFLWSRYVISVCRHFCSSPLKKYEQLIQSKKIREDAKQKLAIEKLQIVYENIYNYESPIFRVTKSTTNSNSTSTISSIFPKMFKWMGSKNTDVETTKDSKVRFSAPKGIYLYGDVGTGKTFLMDLLYDSVSIPRKKRVHFHQFIDEGIHKWRYKVEKRGDPIPPLSKELTNEAWFLCFDEFQVTDVGDAMLLHRLFTHLFDDGIVVVATSNRHPTELYKNGLQRDTFLPFIDLLMQRCDVFNLNSGVDYRLTGHVTAQVYFHPLNSHTEHKMRSMFTKLTHNEPLKSEVLLVNGRKLQVRETSRGVALFSFQELCEQPHGPAEYIAISNKYHTILLHSIPNMNAFHLNEAKRFITLIDELYNHKVKLICSAATTPENLFVLPVSSTVGDEVRFMFNRAVSRLKEMQTSEYLQIAHQSESVL